MAAPHLPIDFDLVDDLLPQHLAEWTVGSGVAEGIARLNVTSYAGEAVLELLIGDRLEDAGGHAQQYVTGEIRKLVHSREQLMLGGWWCQGIDTSNGCRTAAEWGHFKPDHPITEINRVRKYEHPLGVPERIIALQMPDPDYWARIKADPTVALVIDEGAKKAGAWLTAGIAALALPGIWAGAPPVDRDDPEPRIGQGYGRKNWKNRKPVQRELHPDLAVFAPGRRFVISLDHEPTADGADRRDAATRILAEQLFAAGASSVAIAHRPGPTCKGADDLLVAMGPEALHELLENAEDITRGPSAPSWQRQPAQPLTGDRHEADLLADFIADRIYAGRQWAHENERAITDATPLIQLTNTPGTGKSHLVPQVGPRLLEVPDVDRVIYVSDTYRSPSIGSLQRWVAPPTRHSGLVAEQIEGQQRLRRRKRSDSDDAVVETATCQFSGGLQQLREQGASTDAITTFCQKKCPVRMGCRYLSERQEFLQGLKSGEHRLLRCSVESIPVLQAWLPDKAWGSTFLIFDEAPQIEKSQVHIRSIKLDRFPIWGTWLRAEHPAAMATIEGQQLTALLDALATLPSTLSDPAHKQHGLQPQQLIAALPSVPDPAAFAFWPELSPAVDGLTPDTDRHDIDTPVPALLHLLLQSLQTHAPADTTARAFYSPQDGGTITIHAATGQLTAAALSSAGSLVLDGTAALDDITRALHGGYRGPADHLAPVAVSTPTTLRPAALEVTQITDLGAMGRNRGADKQRRLEALLPALQQHTTDRFGPTAKLGVLEKSHFRSRDSGHGIWFVDNQGSNAYEHDQALAMVGTPAPNLTASLTQFQVTHHQPTATLESDSFRAWYGRRMGEQIIQGLHRLRPIRRSGETLLIFLITDINLSNVIRPGQPGVTFTARSSAHFTKAAAPKKERTRDRVVAAIRELHAGGVPVTEITCRRVAEQAGVGRNTAHRQAGDGQWLTFVSLCIDER